MKPLLKVPYFLCLAALCAGAAEPPSYRCKIPFSPQTKSVPIYSKGKFQGNCRVYGDRGASICHEPNDKPVNTSRLIKNHKYDALFFATQKETGVSWKLLKSFVYKETSFIKRYVDITRITSSDGLGVGFMQLTKSAIRNEIRFMRRNFYTEKEITFRSVFENELHHMILGTSWLLHKFVNRHKNKHSATIYIREIANKYKSSLDGWGLKDAKKEGEYLYLKEAISAYNGLSRGCVVNGVVLTSYADVVEYYYNTLLSKSQTPLPYQEYRGNMNIELSLDIRENIATEQIHNTINHKSTKELFDAIGSMSATKSLYLGL